MLKETNLKTVYLFICSTVDNEYTMCFIELNSYYVFLNPSLTLALKLKFVDNDEQSGLITTLFSSLTQAHIHKMHSKKSILNKVNLYYTKAQQK